MATIGRWIALFFPTLAAGAALSAAGLSPPTHLAGAIQTDHEAAVFTGSRVSLQVFFVHPEAADWTVEGEVFQVASALVVPLPIEVVAAPVGGREERVGARLWEFTFEAPVLPRQTDLVLRLTAGPPGLKAEQRPVGRVRVCVFPADLFGELRARAEAERVLFLKGFPELEAFFSAREIQWEEVFDPAKKGEVVLLGLAPKDDGAPELPAPAAGQMLILFVSSKLEAGWLASQTWGRGLTLMAPLEMLEDLSSDPRRQLDFLRLLDRAHRHVHGDDAPSLLPF